MKKLLLISLLLIGCSSYSRESDYRTYYPSKLDRLQDINNFTEVYKLSVDSSEYIVVMKHNSIAITKHK